MKARSYMVIVQYFTQTCQHHCFPTPIAPSDSLYCENPRQQLERAIGGYIELIF